MRSFLRIDLPGCYFLFHDGGFEMRALLPLLLLLLQACHAGHVEHAERLRANLDELREELRESGAPIGEWIELSSMLEPYSRSRHLVDSVLALAPQVRFFSDSLARQDSMALAELYLFRIGEEYFTGDTTAAVFAFLESGPWLRALPEEAEADHARSYAETAANAIEITLSPNMARLTYQAFERARQLALDSGDPKLYHRADNSYEAVARQMLTMPDSVRAAFGPPPERPARIPWVLATLAAAFIAASVAGGWGWNGNTQAPRFARPLSQKKRR